MRWRSWWWTHTLIVYRIPCQRIAVLLRRRAQHSRRLWQRRHNTICSRVKLDRPQHTSAFTPPYARLPFVVPNLLRTDIHLTASSRRPLISLLSLLPLGKRSILLDRAFTPFPLCTRSRHEWIAGRIIATEAALTVCRARVAANCALPARYR
jgi:hypothetical protein